MSASERGRIRAGVVGAGHMGQYHILALAELWDVDLAEVCDVDAEQAACGIGFLGGQRLG